MTSEYLNGERLEPDDRWRLAVILHDFGMLDARELPGEAARLIAAGLDAPAVVGLAILYASTPFDEIRDALSAACHATNTRIVDRAAAVRAVFRVELRAWLVREPVARPLLPWAADGGADQEIAVFWELDDIFDVLEFVSDARDLRPEARRRVAHYLDVESPRSVSELVRIATGML